MNKRGQFYLLGAMIIIVVIMGLAVVSNYIQRSPSVKIYDIKDELDIESGKVVEFGVFNLDKLDGEFGSIEVFFESFVKDYVTYVGNETDLIFIYGDKNNLYAQQRTSLGELRFVEGGGSSLITISQQDQLGKKKLGVVEETVIVEINGDEYPFNLQPGQNFFFIISQEIGEEKYILTS